MNQNQDINLNEKGLNEKRLPIKEGIYQYKAHEGDGSPKAIIVYFDQSMGLCCDARHYSSGLDHKIYSNETNFSVPVSLTGLIFIGRVND